jgi:outer membrane protein assembly factor BamB
MKRRDFLALSATALTVPGAFAARPDVSGVKSRPTPKWEIYYKSPHAKPNGLDIQSDGLWVLDQGPENWMSLVNPADGKLIREFKAEVDAASGLTVDEDGVMWIASTYGNMIVACDSHSGKTIAKYWTPGAGRIYQMKGDAPGRSSKLKPAYPAPPRQGGGASNAGARLPYGQLSLDTKQGAGGTGAHGIVAKDGLLYVAVPPARQLFVIDKKTWVVQDSWHLPGNRTHGLSWDENRETLWNADSNLNAFYRLDGKTGRIIEKIQLPDDSPVIHGAALHEGRMICCDDVGWIWGFQMA